LRTGAKTLLRAIWQRWSIENSLHWMRDVLLREDAHRYREDNGVQNLVTLLSLAINALRLEGIWSRADAKSQQGSCSDLRITIASSALMSCITACIPARIERNPASRNRLRAAVRNVAMAPAPLPL